jgi:hypothetical protein
MIVSSSPSTRPEMEEGDAGGDSMMLRRSSEGRVSGSNGSVPVKASNIITPSA